MSDPVKLDPCPWCHKSVSVSGHDSFGWYVLCQNVDCMAAGPTHKTEAEAIADWNTVAELGSKSK